MPDTRKRTFCNTIDRQHNHEKLAIPAGRLHPMSWRLDNSLHDCCYCKEETSRNTSRKQRGNGYATEHLKGLRLIYPQVPIPINLF